MALALSSAVWPKGLVPTSELDMRVLGVALALPKKCPLPEGGLVTAKVPPGRVDKSPLVAVLLPDVIASPAAVTLEVIALLEVAGTRPPVVVIERPETAGDESPPGWFLVWTMVPVEGAASSSFGKSWTA